MYNNYNLKRIPRHSKKGKCNHCTECERFSASVAVLEYKIIEIVDG